MTTTTATEMTLRIRGQVSECIYRTTTSGQAQLEIKLAAPGDQLVRAIHTYPNKSQASHYAASNLAHQIKGRMVELYGTQPRFARQRLECIAVHIAMDQADNRKDIHS